MVVDTVMRLRATAGTVKPPNRVVMVKNVTHGIAICEVASPVAIMVVSVAVAVVLLLLLLMFDTVVFNTWWENTRSVTESQCDGKIYDDGVTGYMLRTPVTEAGVEDTGGTKAGFGGVGAGHVMLAFLATAAAFLVVEHLQGSHTEIVTRVVAVRDPINVIVGLVIESRGIGFEGRGRVAIVAVIVSVVGFGSVVIEALVFMISFATELDIEDGNNDTKPLF